MVLDDSGYIRSGIRGPSRATASAERVLAGWLGGDGRTFSAGTAREFTLTEGETYLFGHNAYAAEFDGAGQPRCGWSAYSGDGADTDILAAAWDTEGGLWLGGDFAREVRIMDMQGRVLVEMQADSPDAFLLRFVPPEP